MRREGLWCCTLAAATAVVAGAARLPAAPPGDLVVHEWGTFLAMQGSDGVTLDGMYHEEHALPPFVHARSRDQLRIPAVSVKGETPVIYFYTDRKQNVNVRVGFPQGVWTQWYPQALHVGPQFAQAGTPLEPKKGHISWSAEILPAAPGGAPPAGFPGVSADALWSHARQVDAAYVRTRDYTRANEGIPEVDRFLFYRGLGRADLPLRMDLESGGRLTCTPEATAPLRHLFVLRVENGKGAYRYFPALSPRGSLEDVVPSMTGALPREQFTRKVGDDLARRLEEAGLYAKEARAMVNTWRESYFHTDGIRVLFVLPQSWTDRFIPIRVDPKPKELVRVMIGRLEALTPDRERAAESAVRDLSSPDTARRERAFGFLREQGRYAEPVLRRVLGATKDEQVRTACRRLLTTGFVTELRAAAGQAARSKHDEDPVHVRAQLASVLREIGLTAEAREEGAKALSVLRTRSLPADSHSIARHGLRAYARAYEGTGDDPAAAEWYGRFIRFGAQVKTKRDCTGCHAVSGAEGPADMAWYRDWWAGRKYAAALERLGRLEQSAREKEAALAKNPGDATARMMLAYLYQAKGDRQQSERMWTALGVPRGGARVAAGE